MSQELTIIGLETTNGDSMVDQLNAAIASCLTGMMGALDPAADGSDHNVTPGFIWIDTGPDKLTHQGAIKRRNDDDSAWFTIGYLDGHPSPATEALLDLKLNLAGGTLANFLTLHADPTLALHAATKQYVDSVSRPAPVRWFMHGNATVQDGIAYAMMEQAATIKDIVVGSGVAVAGSDLIVRVTRSGPSGAASRSATLPIGQTELLVTVADLAVAVGDVLRWDVTQVGTAGGAPLTTTVRMEA